MAINENAVGSQTARSPIKKETGMPTIIVRIPAETLDATARARLIQGISATAIHTEQIPDDPGKRMLCCVVVEEVAAGFMCCGGVDMGSILVPVLIQVNLPMGVLDHDARARYVAGFHAAVTAALPDEKRRITSSCIINEVVDGNWGINGMIWQLPDFARHAGFLHLQGLLK